VRRQACSARSVAACGGPLLALPRASHGVMPPDPEIAVRRARNGHDARASIYIADRRGQAETGPRRLITSRVSRSLVALSVAEASGPARLFDEMSLNVDCTDVRRPPAP
jgi:hypothetical protein